MHFQIKYLGVVALIEASKQKDLKENQVLKDVVWKKNPQRGWTELREVRTRA